MKKIILFAMAFLLLSYTARAAVEYEYPETRTLVGMVYDAAALLSAKGPSAFNDFRETGTKWNNNDTYVFVLDAKGNMLYHPDPKLSGKNQLDLKDVDGRPLVKLFINKAMNHAKKNEGWVHYKWPQPGKFWPVWKSTFVKQAIGPKNQIFIVGSGIYQMKMEKRFIVDGVDDAAVLIETMGEKAYDMLKDKSRNFFFGNVYIFVDDINGVELVNPAFPELEGKNILNLMDAGGKYMVRDYIDLAGQKGSGWIEYLWPRPEESFPSKKLTYVKKANIKDSWVVAGCGYYLDTAATAEAPKMNAAQLNAFVRDGADLIAKSGEAAFNDFRQANSYWFHGNDYLFVWDMDGKRTVYPPDASMEGAAVLDLKDVRGKPIGKFFYEAVSSPTGEGWVYYEWPKPGELYNSWKTSFLKRVTAPSKKEYIIGSGVYDMKLERSMIVERVEKAAGLIQRYGRTAFDRIRDRAGEFNFLDTYVFVDALDGTELVNPGFPNLEGANLMNYKDYNGRFIVKEYIDLANANGSGCVEGWAKFHGALGRPETPDKYTPIEALKEDQLAKDFDVVFHGLGLSEKQRTGILTTLLEKTAAINKEQDTRFAETEVSNQKKRMETLAKEQGDQMAQFTEDARRAARTAVPEEYKDPATGKVWSRDEINKTIEQAVGVDLALRIFSTLGKFQAEDKSVSGMLSATGVQSPEQAKARWDQLRNDRGWFDRYMAGDAEARREKERLDIIMADTKG